MSTQVDEAGPTCPKCKSREYVQRGVITDHRNRPAPSVQHLRFWCTRRSCDLFFAGKPEEWEHYRQQERARATAQATQGTLPELPPSRAPVEDEDVETRPDDYQERAAGGRD